MPKLIRRNFTLSEFTKYSRASGEDEADFVPSFYRFFFDEENHAEEVFEPGIFFILGRKGTGKSLLARYVTHASAGSTSNYRKFVDVQSFRNVAFQILSKHKDQRLNEKMYFSVWLWILWLAIARQRVDDETAPPSSARTTLLRIISDHFPASGSTSELIERTSTFKLSGGIKDYFSVEKQTQAKERPAEVLSDIYLIENLVLDAFKGSQSESIIFFDDLDDGFEDTELYEQSLASLIYATDHVNRQLHRAGVSAKVVLLLRTDIFRTINSSDLNKFKADNSIVLDWGIDDMENSSLIRMLVYRLSTAIGCSIDHGQYSEAFYELFDDSIENRRTANWMLDLTFARPRDLVQMTALASKACPTHTKFSAYSLLQARPKFSQFLYDDIRNEMKGHRERSFIDGALTLLKGVPVKGTFTIEKLRERKPHLFTQPEGEKLIRDYLAFLYKFGAIGNIYFKTENPAQISYYAWAHRDDQPEPDFDSAFSVHQGLRIALKAGASGG